MIEQTKKKRSKKKKNKSKKQNKRIDFDKMPFEKREKLRAKLKKERVYTKAFKTRQSFGAASECFSFDPEEIQYMVEVYGLNQPPKEGN